MEFSINKSAEILKNTPNVLSEFMNNLSDDWTNCNEGENTWTAKEVLAHLIVCEETDWLSRIRIILSDGNDKNFEPLDMAIHFEIAKNQSTLDLIIKFKQLREVSLREIKSFNLIDTDFKKTGKHPKLGEVNLQQLISAWVTHDLSHIVQISRIMAKQNKELVGGFKEYLSILSN